MKMNTKSFPLILFDELQEVGAQEAPLAAYLAALDPTLGQEEAKRALREGEEFPCFLQGVHFAGLDNFPHAQYSTAND